MSQRSLDVHILLYFSIYIFPRNLYWTRRNGLKYKFLIVHHSFPMSETFEKSQMSEFFLCFFRVNEVMPWSPADFLNPPIWTWYWTSFHLSFRTNKLVENFLLSDIVNFGHKPKKSMVVYSSVMHKGHFWILSDKHNNSLSLPERFSYMTRHHWPFPSG